MSSHRMTSWALLVILGACFSVLTLVVSDSSSTTSSPENDFEECAIRARNVMYTVFDPCMSKVFTKEGMEETSEIYNGTHCVYCRHFCRNQDKIVNCVMEATESLQNVSNTAIIMVPFGSQLLVEYISAICDNDANLFLAYAFEDNKDCFQRTYSECRSHIKRSEDPYHYFSCGSDKADVGPPSIELDCRAFMDFLECAGEQVRNCSPDSKNAVSILKTKLRDNVLCKNYV